jgi:hypothetical protein
MPDRARGKAVVGASKTTRSIGAGSIQPSSASGSTYG